jgi:hypothetical protein
MKLYYFTTGADADKLAQAPHFTEAVKMFDSATHRHARSLTDDPWRRRRHQDHAHHRRARRGSATLRD